MRTLVCVFLFLSLSVAGLACDAEDPGTGQILGADGTLVVHIGLCSGDQAQRLRILSIDKQVLWMAEIDGTDAPSSVVEVDESPGIGWRTEAMNSLDVRANRILYVEVSFRRGGETEILRWTDALETSRLSSTQVYLGSRGDYVDPEEFLPAHRRNVC